MRSSSSSLSTITRTIIPFFIGVLALGFFASLRSQQFAISEAKAAVGVHVSKMTPLVVGVRNLYAPTVFTTGQIKRMLLCGWLTDSDPDVYLQTAKTPQTAKQVAGADKIWLSEMSGKGWTIPKKVFEKVGYHVCDPSVVHPPSTDGVDRSGWLYMYYTALGNEFAHDSLAQLQNNVTGLASSIDGGKTWTDRGIILGRKESGDGFGVWAASAVVVGNEVWLYYHTGSQDFSKPITYRQRMHANGVTRIGVAEPLEFPEHVSLNPGTQATLLTNMEVTKFDTIFYMVANTTDLKNIVLFASTDGLSWKTLTKERRIIQGGAIPVLTPYVEVISPHTLHVFFGFGGGAGIESKSVHEWELTIN